MMKHMSRIVVLLAFFLVPTFLQAQDLQSEARHYLAKQGVSSSEINRIIEIQLQTRRRVRAAQLELNVLKAELEKALFPVNVDMKRVHQLLDQSLKSKMQAELANIEGRVETRKILGDYKFAAYEQFMRNALHRAYARPKPPYRNRRYR